MRTCEAGLIMACGRDPATKCDRTGCLCALWLCARHMNSEGHIKAEPESLWQDDKVQFARLICEIVAAQPWEDMTFLMESMDLRQSEVEELFDRAEEVWEAAKKLHT